MAKNNVASIKRIREAVSTPPVGEASLLPWSGDVDQVFVPRADIRRRDCYDAATMKMEQVELLLRGTCLFVGDDDDPRTDPVITAALALLQQARAAYAAVYMRAES